MRVIIFKFNPFWTSSIGNFFPSLTSSHTSSTVLRKLHRKLHFFVFVREKFDIKVEILYPRPNIPTQTIIGNKHNIEIIILCTLSNIFYLVRRIHLLHFPLLGYKGMTGQGSGFKRRCLPWLAFCLENIKSRGVQSIVSLEQKNKNEKTINIRLDAKQETIRRLAVTNYRKLSVSYFCFLLRNKWYRNVCHKFVPDFVSNLFPILCSWACRIFCLVKQIKAISNTTYRTEHAISHQLFVSDLWRICEPLALTKWTKTV